MNARNGWLPKTVLVGALLCLVIAVGAALQGPFRFGPPRWDPTNGFTLSIPPALQQQHSTQAPVDPGLAQPGSLDLAPILWSLGILALAVGAFFLWRWLRRLLADRAGLGMAEASPEPVVIDPDSGSEAEPDVPTLRRGLELAAELLDSVREPRDGIVRAWIGLQEAAEDSGMRRKAAETPTEFTSRVLGAVNADRDAARRLLALYLRARFDEHPSTHRDVASAREALATLSATWSSPPTSTEPPR